jgi:hypothetical protein
VGQGLDLRVEFLVLALEEDRDLTEHVSIADRIEAKHTLTASSRCARGRIFSHFFDDERLPAGLVLLTPQGHRVEGLDRDGLIAVLRALA